jgi:hypothetical protein
MISVRVGGWFNLMQKRWITILEFIDIETGEILNVRNERELKSIGYGVFKKTKTYKENEKFRAFKFTVECIRSRQLELF